MLLNLGGFLDQIEQGRVNHCSNKKSTPKHHSRRKAAWSELHFSLTHENRLEDSEMRNLCFQGRVMGHGGG